MSEKPKPKETYGLEYKEWGHFYYSLQKDLDEIKHINKIVRNRTNLILDFYSAINTLFNNHKVYIVNSKQLQEILNKIEIQITDPKYIRDIKEQNISSNMINFHFKIIKRLEDCYQTILSNFEQNDLIPRKVLKIPDDPARAVARGTR